MQSEEKPIFVRIPKDKHRRLRICVLKEETSIAAVVRGAIDDYLENCMEESVGCNQDDPSTTPVGVMKVSKHSDYRRNGDE